MHYDIGEADYSQIDFDALMHVMNSAFAPQYGEAWTAAQTIGMLSLPGTALYIAQHKETQLISGFALLRATDEEAELLLLAIHPDQQRQYIGRGLVEYAVNIMKEKKKNSIFVEVRENNPALKFYHSLGFHQIGLRKNYYTGDDGQKFDALTLCKCL